MSVEDVLHRRGIKELLHFTTGNGLLGMLGTGSILPRSQLPENQLLEFVYAPNCEFRTDPAWIGHTSLSISNINGSFFDICQGRWHAGSNKWWAIVSVDPELATHQDVVFTTTNNSYAPHVQRAQGELGLEAMFADMVICKTSSWRKYRGSLHQPWQPTCEQAEVLYPGEIPVDRIQAIYFQEEEHLDSFHGIIEALDSSHLSELGSLKPAAFERRRPS